MLKPEYADTIAQYALFSAQANGWDGSKVYNLRCIDAYPNNDPADWRETLLAAQAWINDHIFIDCAVNGKASILRPVQITDVAPDRPDTADRFPKDGKLPEGCIAAEARGLKHAVGLHEIPQAKDGKEFSYTEPVPLDTIPYDQHLFEAILGVGKTWAAWMLWGMFIKVVDRAPDLDRGTKDNPVTVTPEWVKYWALRTGGRRLRRRLDTSKGPGQLLAAVVDTYCRSLPMPVEEWDKKWYRGE